MATRGSAVQIVEIKFLLREVSHSEYVNGIARNAKDEAVRTLPAGAKGVLLQIDP